MERIGRVWPALLVLFFPVHFLTCARGEPDALGKLTLLLSNKVCCCLYSSFTLEHLHDLQVYELLLKKEERCGKANLLFNQEINPNRDTEILTKPLSILLNTQFGTVLAVTREEEAFWKNRRNKLKNYRNYSARTFTCIDTLIYITYIINI